MTQLLTDLNLQPTFGRLIKRLWLEAIGPIQLRRCKTLILIMIILITLTVTERFHQCSRRIPQVIGNFSTFVIFLRGLELS